VRRHHGLSHCLDVAVITPKPGRQSRVVDVSHVVTLGRLGAVVIRHGEELVLPLAVGVLATAIGGQDLLGHLEVHAEVHRLEQLLAST